MIETIDSVKTWKGVAYSYVRFSTSKQELGDSLRRQVEAAEEYCKREQLQLLPVSYRDLGVSAFKRKNIETGALAAFTRAVKEDKIPRGSYLIIEQFDRMSRADADIALSLPLDLVRSGIKVVTLVDNKIWDKESIKDIGNLILAIVYMSRANNESAAKAQRLSEAWRAKKNAASAGTALHILTSECPRWLKPNDNKTGFIVLEDRAESIKKVFDLRINGYGISSIVTRANAEKWPVPGKAPVRRLGESKEDFAQRCDIGTTWHTSTVGRLLKNRALLGDYQPHVFDSEQEPKRTPIGEPIKNYYPQVLNEQAFLRAQAKAERSGRFPGRRDASLKNWLQGLLRCTCGQSFIRKNKDSLAQPGYARYYCTSRCRGISKCPGSNAKELETAVLSVVSHCAPLLFEGSAKAEIRRSRLDVLETEIAQVKRNWDNYLESVGNASTAVARASYRAQFDKALLRLETLEREFSQVSAELADMPVDYDTVFESIVKAVQDIDSLDARARLRESLSRVISKVVVHQVPGYIQVYMRSSQDVVAHPIRKNALLPDLDHNFANAPNLLYLSDKVSREYGRLHVDEEWWQDTRNKLKKQREQDRCFRLTVDTSFSE